MKKLCAVLLIFAMLASFAACGIDPATTAASNTTTLPATTTTAAPTTTLPAPTQPETYTVTIAYENYEGIIEDWEITGVYAEATFMSDGLPLRVLYVVSGSSVTTLRDFYPDDYPYTGAYKDHGDGTFSYDYDLLKPYAQWETIDEDGVTVRKAGGGYSSLPDGSWFFGCVAYGNSFFVVVGDMDAAANGTVPSM